MFNLNKINFRDPRTIVIIIILVALGFVLYKYYSVKDFNLEKYLQSFFSKKKKVTFKTLNGEIDPEIIDDTIDDGLDVDTEDMITTVDMVMAEENEKELQTFMDITIDDKPVGRIIMKLYDDVVPKTAKNFLELCRAKKYKNTIFHRVVKDFMIQGGDIQNMNGKGGYSIYGSKFDDENYKIKHDKPFLLSMANRGKVPDENGVLKGTNGSQFFITTVRCPHLDNKHVVFGEVVDGFEIVKQIEAIWVRDQIPQETIRVIDCGIIN